MKSDLPYFTHDNDAAQHAKMKALRARYGWAGYGRFWALNEAVARAEEARLDLSRPVIRCGFADEIGLSSDEIDDFLAFLSDPEECGLIRYEAGVVTTERTSKEFEKVEKARERARANYQPKKADSEAKDPNSHSRSDTEQSRAEERRKDKSRAEQRDCPAAAITPTALQDRFHEHIPEFRGNSTDWGRFAAVMAQQDLQPDYVRWLGEVYLPQQHGILNGGAWVRRHFGEHIGEYRAWRVQEAVREERGPPSVGERFEGSEQVLGQMGQLRDDLRLPKARDGPQDEEDVPDF